MPYFMVTGLSSGRNATSHHHIVVRRCIRCVRCRQLRRPDRHTDRLRNGHRRRQPLQSATFALRSPASPDGIPLYGAAANADGLYLIRSIAPGRYDVTFSFVGYDLVRDTLTLAADERATRSAALVATEEELGAVLIQAEREHGMARVTAGQQRITPEDVELVPSPDVSADLANYLTTLPGVVTTGDRGGQVYIRGGEPSQNLVLLDGMVVYQPFHVLGFYSAFPSDILNTVDLYAGGFPARYSGRLSSVIDVSSR